MAYDTDERLKSLLDTNQLYREQMCLAVLAVDKRFSDVRPRQPRGGPDGGRDIEAIFRQKQRAFGAVGFVNQANDSDEQKRRIKEKFSEDLQSALRGDPKPEVIIFFTNVNMTVGEKDELIAAASRVGLSHCEIFDRERIRIVLDSADGFAIRFQYLNVPLSVPEQASFFAKWGDDIQSVIATGFQQIDETLARVLFLQEAEDVLSTLSLVLELNDAFPADKIGHFRAFCNLHLREPKHRIFSVLFGTFDRADRLRAPNDKRSTIYPPGIKHSIGGGQWEEYFSADADEDTKEDKDHASGSEAIKKFELVGSSEAVGMDPVHSLHIGYTHDDILIRFRPRLRLRDFDDCIFMPILNSSLADKLKAIHVLANGYKLQEITRAEMSFDTSPLSFEMPTKFTDTELADGWVRIRPKIASIFNISFSSQTPKRLFLSPPTPNSLARLDRRSDRSL